jgi:hypothetical protein
MLTTDDAARPTARAVAERLRLLGDGADHDAGATRPMTGLVPAPDPAPVDGTGHRLAAVASGLRARAAATTEHQRVLAGVGAVLVLLLVLAGVAAGGRGGGGTGEVPADTPRRLQQPLQDLHDAVDGRTP